MDNELIIKLVKHLKSRNPSKVIMAYDTEDEIILLDEYAEVWTKYTMHMTHAIRFILNHLSNSGCKRLLNKYIVHRNYVIEHEPLKCNIFNHVILHKYSDSHKSIIIKNILNCYRNNIFYTNYELLTYAFNNVIWLPSDEPYYDKIKSYASNSINKQYILQFHDQLVFNRSLRGTWIIACSNYN